MNTLVSTHVAAHIRTKYLTIDAFSATEAIVDILVEHFFLVVEDQGEFRGILTSTDITASPRKLVIDCLHHLPRVTSTHSIFDVVALMRESKRLALPVWDDNTFRGVVVYCDLVDHIASTNDKLQASLYTRSAQLSEVNRQLQETLEIQKKTYAQLQIKEAAVEGSLNGVVIVELTGTISYINQAFLDLWHIRDKNSVIGQPINNFWHDHRNAFDVTKKVLQEGRFFGELKALREDKTTFTAQVAAALIFDDSGLPICMKASFLDVTSQREMTEALRIYNERFRVALKNSPILVTNQDRSLRYTWVGNSALSKIGVNWIGRDAIEVLGNENANRIVAVKQQVLASGKPAREVVPLIVDGRSYWFDLTVEPLLDESGDVQGLTSAALDITPHKLHERKLEESESRYRSLVENSTDGIAVNINHYVMYANPAMGRLLEVDSEVELLGRKTTEFLHPDVVEETIKRARHVLETNHYAHDVEVKIITNKENVRDFSVTIVPIHFSGQGATMLIAHDITEKKREEQIRRAQESKLRQADKMIALGTLVAGVAHEINNPTASILGDVQNLEIMLNSILPLIDDYVQQNPDAMIGAIPYSEIRERIPHSINNIADSGKRVANIVRKLRDFAMPSPETPKEPVDLNAIVRSSLELVRKYTQWATHSLEIDLCQNLPRLRGKNEELEHMVINLVLNACDALTSRHQRVVVMTRWEKSSEQILLQVTDQGIGITMEQKSRIFEPFFTTKRNKGGTGLGLSIVNAIVRDHAGEIFVESTPGEGTTFTVYLPQEKTS